MTGIEAREYRRHGYQWVIPGRPNSALIGDIRNVIAAAAAKYEELTGDRSTGGDWLRVAWDAEQLTFWFEIDEPEPCPF